MLENKCYGKKFKVEHGKVKQECQVQRGREVAYNFK